MSDPSAKASLITMILECIVYGIYFTVFLQTLHILRRKAVPGFLFVYLASTTLLLFALITLRLAADAQITVQALTSNRQHVLIAPELAKLTYGAYVVLTIIADIFMVYRVFAVWSRNLTVSVIPCSLSAASIVNGGLLVSNVGSKSGFNEPKDLYTTFYCITLALNVLCTALIAFKLYISERQTEFSSSLKLRWTSSKTSIPAHVAALYSAFVVVIVVCNVLRVDDVHLVLLSTQTPSMIGLTFSLIIVRVTNSSRAYSGKTFTSIGIGQSSVLQFEGQLRTVDGAGTGMDLCSVGQSSEKATVAPITTATARLNPPPCVLTDDVENRL
ncbi:hypothetical protein PQX77_001036 [Marasmius sp. AFHP31]|nr:hypothetical protein PQX77_012092 [Marasmius sp. AFHP31]KAK1235729.1 hypothetical protein PQX77_001036 [Marasmius sp. AFHP31]